MPIYEYRCSGCHLEFEKLVFSSTVVVSCPECRSEDIERRPSSFGMSGVERQTSSECSGCSASSCTGCGH